VRPHGGLTMRRNLGESPRSIIGIISKIPPIRSCRSLSEADMLKPAKAPRVLRSPVTHPAPSMDSLHYVLDKVDFVY